MARIHLFPVAVLFLTLTLTACSSAPPKPAAPATEQYLYPGFSLSLPVDSGWRDLRKQPGQALLVRPGNRTHERYTIQALLVSLPAFADDYEFMDYIKTSMAAEDNTSTSEVYDQSVTFITGNRGQCIQYSSKSVDMSVMDMAPDARPMILDMVNFTCRHPDKQDAGVHLVVARRHHPDSAAEDLRTRALNIFYSLDFQPL